MSNYAIIETGGKQYRVQPGDVIEVERLTGAEPGESVNLDRILMVSTDDGVRVGNPLVPGARVVAKVENEAKGKKIIVFKHKPKVRYRRKNGHRQWFSRIEIQEISVGGT
ncbi:MAG: ribosomal protein [Dehalococcoidia bacterium]|nr:ribosomal protein [Dehalococcoidia bacterium]